jgi:hypothetical protein
MSWRLSENGSVWKKKKDGLSVWSFVGVAMVGKCARMGNVASKGMTGGN